jgi:Anti-sigma-K factor rskA
MELGEPESNPTVGRASGESASVSRPPRLQRVGLWQAIAGMSFAIAVASLIVTSELTKALAHRTNYVNRRVAALNAVVRDLRRQTAAAQKKLGTEREQASVGEVFEKILFAPDLRTIKLVAPQDLEKQKPGAQSDGVQGASGRLAMSESAGGAMLEASGLKPSENFKVYRIWWMPKRGAPVWAADFIVGDDGLATVAVDLPPARLKQPSIDVTLEDESYADAPTGPVALKGDAAHAERVANRGRSKK